MSKVSYVKDKQGNEVEVVTRRKKRKKPSPMFGGPESVIGQRVQQDLDYMVLGDFLHEIGKEDG